MRDFRQASAKLYLNLTRVCLRAYPPFGLYPVVGMQGEVNSRVHLTHRPLLKFCHIAGPFRRIVAKQVVPWGFRGIRSCRGSSSRGTHKFRKEGKGVGPMIRPLGSRVVGVGNRSSPMLGVHNADSVSIVLPKYSAVAQCCFCGKITFPLTLIGNDHRLSRHSKNGDYAPNKCKIPHQGNLGKYFRQNSQTK